MKGEMYMQNNPTEYAVGEIKNENKFERPEIPKEVMSELARFFLPDIIAFFESEEGKREYEEWKNNNK